MSATVLIEREDSLTPPPDSPDSTSSEQTTPSMSQASSAPSSILLSPLSLHSRSPLLTSPSEIIHKVLCDSGTEDAIDLAHAARTCRELHSFIYGNPDRALWRDIHLQKFDDPRSAGAFVEPREDLDWKKRVQDREFVARILRDWGPDRYEELPEHLDTIIDTTLDLWLDLPAVSEDQISFPSAEECRNSELLRTILTSPAFRFICHHLSAKEIKPLLRPLRGQIGNPNRRPIREVINPNLSRLHAILCPEYNKDEIEDRQHRGWMREVVYTASNYSESNDYGPFKSDGSVDWSLMDAISSVMMSNARDVLRDGEAGWTQALSPLSYGVEPTRSWGFHALKGPAGEVWDWAGVEGSWCGSYAFLDYADWLALNEPRSVLVNRLVHSLDLTTYHEAIGDLMKLDLRMVRPDDTKLVAILDSLPPIESPLPSSDLLPPIRFCGHSTQSSQAHLMPADSPPSSVRGVVRLTSDSPPQVRWTLVIRYGGEDRWRLECAQTGGRGSKRGFFGIWTDAMKEEHSPNGPVWYWKP